MMSVRRLPSSGLRTAGITCRSPRRARARARERQRTAKRENRSMAVEECKDTAAGLSPAGPSGIFSAAVARSTVTRRRERVSAKVGLKIGLITGREWSFPPRFIDAVNARDNGVTAEYALLGGESSDGACPYAVLIDRISHEVPFYRAYLKHAVLQGVAVVNNPFMWSADDKFFGATLATRLGVAS